MSGGDFFKEDIQEGESRDKGRVSAECWQVECNVDGGSTARNLQKNRKERWRSSGKRSDKWIQFGSPHHECTTIGLAGVKRELRTGDLFTIE